MSETPDVPSSPESGGQPSSGGPPPGGPPPGGDVPGPPGQPVELRALQLGEMIDTSIKLYQSNFAVLAGIVAVIMVPWTLIVYALGESGSTPLLLAAVGAQFAINPVVSGAIAWAAAEIYLGEDPTVGATYRYVGRRVGPVIGVSLLTGLAILLGFVLLVIPGIIAAARLFASTIVVVIEDRGVGDGMRRSWDLVKGTTGRVLGYLIVIQLLVGVFGAVLGLLGGIADSTAVAILVDIVISVVLTPITAVFGVLLYYDLRIRKEAYDLEVMARELTSGA